MGFVFVDTDGVLGAAAATDGLAAQAAGSTGQAAAAGAVVPPGLEEISTANAAKITEYSTQVAAMLGMASGVQATYGTSVGVASGIYSLTDALSALDVSSVI
jgi:hypothetical protein